VLGEKLRADVSAFGEDSFCQIVRCIHLGDQLLFVIIFCFGKFCLGDIQHLKHGNFALKCGMNLEERFAWTIGVEHSDDLPIQLPQSDDIFEFHMEDVFIDMPAPVIPTQERP